MLSLARDYNAENDITGCLLFHNNHFTQLLEGEENKITALYNRIADDKRHHGVALIKKEEINGRIFKEWSMAFHDYGLNGSSANLKLGQVDAILKKSRAFDKKSESALNFFSTVKDILFHQ
jgi:hypothetical protein